MIINKVVVGPLEENCYILEKDNKVLVIDPGDEYKKIKNNLKDKEVVGVLITHAHFDHVGALEEILNDYDVPLYYNNVNNEINYNKLVSIKEKEYSIEDFNFKIIYTKGHRNDSVTFYFYENNIMFTGDFLFKLSIGRTDLEYASFNEMKESLEKIKKYDDDIIIYPGHGEETILGFEKKNNIYLVK